MRRPAEELPCSDIMADISPSQPEAGNTLIFKHHYDREDEVATKDRIKMLLKGFQTYAVEKRHYNENGSVWVENVKDAQAIGEVREVFSGARYLFNKYREKDEADTCGNYLAWLTEQKELDTPGIIKDLDLLLEKISKILGVKHGFKDRTDDALPWDRQVKKKLEFPEFTPEEELFYQSINREWKKQAWLTTFYVVRCEGDAHILLAGPNLSGKSSTAIPFLYMCNYYLREFWHVDRYNEYYIEKHPEAKGEKLRKFAIERDVYVTPKPEDLKERFKAEQYQTIDINEGMEAATNLQSMKSEVVELGIGRFTTRSFHNIIVWEYQVAERPSAMMLEGMNFWMQKMRKRHYILSIASTLVRKKDPYYMKELAKCRSDKEIGLWMTKINPNYVHTFRAPKMGPNLKRRFQMWYDQSKEEQTETQKVKTSIGKGYELIIKRMWDEVNKTHKTEYLEIGEKLKKMGYEERDVAQFMRDYGKYNRLRLYEGFGEKSEVATNGA